MSACLISLGSNLGKRKIHLRTALQLLDETDGVRVVRASSYVGTRPIGGPSGQRDFLNAAAVIETKLSPLELLRTAQSVEQALGRIRVERWGSRTLDIDLLLYDDLVLHAADLEIPHPRFVVRQFMLQPAAEIAGDWVYPINGWTVQRLLANLSDTPRSVAIYSSVEGATTALELGLRSQALSAWKFVDCGSEARLPSVTSRFAVMLTSDTRANLEKVAELSSLACHPEMCPAIWVVGDSPAAAVAEVVAACQASG